MFTTFVCGVFFIFYIKRQDTTFESIHLSFQSEQATDMSSDERVL